MNRPSSALIGALASRLCHDLISPIGAIANGIDLMREVRGQNIDDELRMIGQSAERASRLLQYYRIAFGAVGDASELGRGMLADTAAALIGVKRVSLDWADRTGPAILRAEARLILLMLLCANAMVGMRGVIRVVLPAQSTLPVSVVVEGDGVFAEEELLAMLHATAEPGEVLPQHIEFAVLREGAADLGHSLSATRTTGGLILALSHSPSA